MTPETNSLRLLYWPTCPYACKVLGVLEAIHLSDQVEKILMHPWEASSPLPDHNPLHKIPVLITKLGVPLYDSRVICAYLISLSSGDLLIPEVHSSQQWEDLRLQALADGLNDALILKLTEENVRAPHLQSFKWIRRQQMIIERGLDELETLTSSFPEDAVTLGLLAVAATLGYVTYRYGGNSWRGTHPRLSSWYARVIELPLYKATLPIEKEAIPENIERLNE